MMSIMRFIISRIGESGKPVIRFAGFLFALLPYQSTAQVISIETYSNINRFVGGSGNENLTGLTSIWQYYYWGKADFYGISSEQTMGLGMNFKSSGNSPLSFSLMYREALWESGHKTNYDLDMNDNYYKFVYPFHSVALGISCRVWQSKNKQAKWYVGFQFERPGLGTHNRGRFQGWQIANAEWRELPDNDYLNLYSQVSMIQVSPLKRTSITSSIEYIVYEKDRLRLGAKAHISNPRDPTITVRRPEDAQVAPVTAAVMTWGTGVFCALDLHQKCVKSSTEGKLQ
jgi:hypothetical protein